MALAIFCRYSNLRPEDHQKKSDEQATEAKQPDEKEKGWCRKSMEST